MQKLEIDLYLIFIFILYIFIYIYNYIFEYLKGKEKKMCGLNRLMVDLFIYVGRLFIAKINVELTV